MLHVRNNCIVIPAQAGIQTRGTAGGPLDPGLRRDDVGGWVALGDQPGFDLNMGGRLVSIGNGYQNAPPAMRAEMMLNGERVAELDIKGSHLTIVHAKLGNRCDRADPYDIPEMPDRWVVKKWVTMVLGNGKFHLKWPKKATAEYTEREGLIGRSLETDYPIADVHALLRRNLPEIDAALDQGLTWARLQYLESCAVIDAVEQLALEHDIPALPVHDSIIVPASKISVAEQVLSACFERNVGVTPKLERKY